MTDSSQVTGGMEEELKKTVFYNQLSASSQVACAHFLRSALTHDRARLVEEVENLIEEEARKQSDAERTVEGARTIREGIGAVVALELVRSLLKDKGVK